MYANGTKLDWRARPNKRKPEGRLRVVRTLTQLTGDGPYIVRVEEGAHGERGKVFVLSPARLTPHVQPAA